MQMIGISRRIVLRWLPKRVVRDLPRCIAEAFGAYDRCTFGQARRAIEDLRLPDFAVPYAYAAVCGLRELDVRFPLSADEYRRLRAELAELFHLPSSAFTIKDPIAPAHGRGPAGSEGSNSTGLGDGGAGV